MSGQWGALLGGIVGRPLAGNGSFRLMPTDDFATGQASGAAACHADGYALDVTYTWTHPQDGPQDGVLLVSSPSEDDGRLEAMWLDSWHQKPGPLRLTGTVSSGTVELEGTYAVTWGWQICVDIEAAAGLHIVMRNVVPQEFADSKPDGEGFAGPYDVMDLQLS